MELILLLWPLWCISNSTAGLFSMDLPKLTHETSTSKMHPTNILCKEKRDHGIALVLQVYQCQLY